MSTKTLYLVRGLPGSGKSSLAESLHHSPIEADQFFIVDGEYRFDATRLKDAHADCKKRVWMRMRAKDPVIVVANTFSTEWEMRFYLKAASRFQYKAVTLIVENRHGGESVHNVPSAVVRAMRKRFEVVL